MAPELGHALDNVEYAAGVLFDADPTVRSVGIGLFRDKLSFIAIRNGKAPMPFRGRLKPAPDSIRDVPVHFQVIHSDPVALTGSPMPLAGGLQIQNYDDDVRAGRLANGSPTFGSLGCLVRLPDGKLAMLSNNHVVAGENDGIVGHDRIVHPHSTGAAPAVAGILTGFVPLKPSPAGASPSIGTVVWNEVDAAVATLEPGWQHAQSASGVAQAQLGDKVHKRGCTTGSTQGTVTEVGAIVHVPYTPGDCWFRRSFVISAADGQRFADHGDSGAAIERDDGVILGLLYAGNDTHTWACPIDEVFAALNCCLP